MVTKEFSCRVLGSRSRGTDFKALPRGGGVYSAPGVIDGVLVLDLRIMTARTVPVRYISSISERGIRRKPGMIIPSTFDLSRVAARTQRTTS